MEIQVSSNLRSIPTIFFMEPVKLKGNSDEVESTQIPYFEIGQGESDNQEFVHWNGSHLRNVYKPSKWSEFHTEELIRCVMEKLQEDNHRTSIIQQRTHILQAILRKQWTQSTDMDLSIEELNDGLRGRMLTIPGVTPIGGEKWNRATEPVYGSLEGNTEWAIILDARTMQEITEGGISAEDLRCYSNGLRLVKLNAVTTEGVVPSEDIITEGRGIFLPEATILFWLNQAIPFENEQETFPRYKPFMEIDGTQAFRHQLRDNLGSSRPLTKHGECILTGNTDEPLVLSIGEDEIELGIKFRQEDDGQERLHIIGFVKTIGEKAQYLSIHPDAMNWNFSNEKGEELTRTRQSILKKELIYNTYRDLTKAFRICAKKQCNPEYSFTYLSGLGISAYHIRWFRMTKKTPLESEMKTLILRVNGWE